MTETSEPVCSVVIPVYNQAGALAACLAALAQQTLPTTHFEVLVVDNASDDDPARIVAGRPGVRLLTETKPGSYAARNRGLRAARGRIIALTDADCRPAADWLERALARFEADCALMAIGGRIAMAAAPKATAAERFDCLMSLRQDHFVYRRGFAATANLVVRRELFESVGGFDPKLKSGGDREFGARILAAGYRLVYASEVVVEHRARCTLKALLRKRRRILGGAVLVADPSPRSLPAPPAHWSAPPRGLAMACSLLLSPQAHGLNRFEALQVLAVGALLMLVGWSERLRLALGGRPLR